MTTHSCSFRMLCGLAAVLAAPSAVRSETVLTFDGLGIQRFIDPGNDQPDFQGGSGFGSFAAGPALGISQGTTPDIGISWGTSDPTPGNHMSTHWVTSADILSWAPNDVAPDTTRTDPITFTAFQGLTRLLSLDVVAWTGGPVDTTIYVSRDGGPPVEVAHTGYLSSGTVRGDLTAGGTLAAARVEELTIDVRYGGDFHGNYVNFDNLRFAQVPEPGSAAPAAAGLGLAWLLRRRYLRT